MVRVENVHGQNTGKVNVDVFREKILVGRQAGSKDDDLPM